MFSKLANKIAIKSSNNPPSKNVSIINLVYRLSLVPEIEMSEQSAIQYEFEILSLVLLILKGTS